MRGRRVNRNIGYRFTLVHRSFILALVVKFFTGVVDVRLCRRHERPRRASRTPVNGNRGSGRRRSGCGGGGRTFPNTRSRVAAVSRGALDKLEPELFEDGAIRGVMFRLVRRIVADHAFLTILFASAAPTRDMETKRACLQGVVGVGFITTGCPGGVGRWGARRFTCLVDWTFPGILIVGDALFDD